MRVVKPNKIGLLHKVFETARPQLCIAALVGFELENPAAILDESQTWKQAFALLGKQAILDLVMPKPRGEVLLAARACAPGGHPVRGLQVRLICGPVDKTLDVLGDRVWRLSATGVLPSEPEHFTSMPVIWPLAFGGAQYKRNPLGRGHVPKGAEFDPDAPLPNIEYPRTPVDSPHDHVEPAGFGPTGLDWPIKTQLAGTYDQNWLDNRFPGLPDDLDWSYFQLAPRDQWAPEYFHGREEFALENMHPTKPLIQGRLPGLTVRAFIRRHGHEGIEELKTRLDTIWLLPEAGLGIAIHRCVTDAADDEASDAEALILGLERQEHLRKFVKYYEACLERRLHPKTAHIATLRQNDLLPPDLCMAHNLAQKKEAEDQVGEQLQQKLQKARFEKQYADMRQQFAQAGLDPKLLPEKPPPPDIPGVNPKELDPATMDLEVVLSDAFQHKVQAYMEAQQAQAKEAFAAMGVDLEQVQKEAKGATFRLTDQLTDFQNDAAMAPLRESGAMTPEIEEGLRKSQEQLVEQYYRFGQSFPPPPLLEEEPNQTLRRLVAEAGKRGISLSGRDFSGADLSGLDLSGLDLRWALLAGANLAKANLSEADCRGAMLAHAKLDNALFKGTNLTEANLGKTSGMAVDFSNANLRGAILAEADLGQALLREADLAEVEASQAKLENANLSWAVMSRANWTMATLTGAKFVQAVLDNAVFYATHLEQADFSQARGTRVFCMRAKAAGAVFRRAILPKLRAVAEADFSGADFREAQLSGSCLRSAILNKAVFDHADLDGCDFSESDCTQTSFRGVTARRAKFMKSDLEEAVCSGSDLFEANLRKARLVNCRLDGCNCFQAEFFRAKVHEVDFSGANLSRTKLKAWRLLDER